MTPEEAHAQIAEAKLRSDVMDQSTVILNLFHQFLNAETDSDLENALSDELEKIVGGLVKEGENGIIGQVLFSLVAIIMHASNPEAIQEFLNEQSEEIQRLVEEAHDGHTH